MRRRTWQGAGLAVVAVVVAITVTAALTGKVPWDTKRSTAAASATGSASADGMSVNVPGGLPDGARLTLRAVALPDAGLPEAIVPVGQAARVTLTGAALPVPATVTFPTPDGVDGTRVLPLVVWQDASGGWRWLPPQWTPGQTTMSAQTDHFSIGFAAKIDLQKWAENRKGEFVDYVTSRSGAAQPSCGDEAAGRGDDVTVVSDGGDSVKWCFGLVNGQRLLKISNNRRMFTEITYPSAWKVVAGSSVTFSPETLVRALSTGAASALVPEGKAVRILDGGDTLTLEVPPGQTGRVLADMSVWAYYVSILQFGVETYAAVAKASNVALGTAAQDGWQRIAQRLAGTASIDGYTDALRACGKGVAQLTESDVGEIGADLLKFGWSCIPELMQADPVVTGVRMFAVGAVLATVGIVVSFVLTAAHLLLAGMREIWDNFAAIFTGNESDPVYDIVVARRLPDVLPALPETQTSARALSEFLHKRIGGLDPPSAQAGEPTCEVVSVAGASLAQGAVDLYLGITPEGDGCGGDSAGTFYKIRNWQVIASGSVCGDCDPSQIDSTDYDRLTAPYKGRRWSAFDVVSTGSGTGWALALSPQDQPATGAIQSLDLRNATLPATSCASGSWTSPEPIKLVNGSGSSGSRDSDSYTEASVLEDPAYGDLDGNGTTDALLVVLCGAGGTYMDQIVLPLTLQEGKLALIGGRSLDAAAGGPNRLSRISGARLDGSVIVVEETYDATGSECNACLSGRATVRWRYVAGVWSSEVRRK